MYFIVHAAFVRNKLMMMMMMIVSTAPELIKLIVAVLYVSHLMGFTGCYKTEGFYIYICSFSTIFYGSSIINTCLRS